MIDYLDALRREGDSFTSAARAGDLASAVAACPDWNLADLVYHLGEVHDFWCTVVEQRIVDRPDLKATPRPPDEQLVEWYAGGLDHLVDVLTATEPDTEVWMWSPEHNVAYIRRRMAQETAVHRWDAELAATGSAAPIDQPLAVDGIDEYLSFMLPGWVQDGAAPMGGSVHLHATDGEGEWLVRPDDPGGYVVTRGHEKGDAAIRGSANDLLLALWRRRSLDDLDVVGDREVAARLLAATDNN